MDKQGMIPVEEVSKPDEISPLGESQPIDEPQSVKRRFSFLKLPKVRIFTGSEKNKTDLGITNVEQDEDRRKASRSAKTFALSVFLGRKVKVGAIFEDTESLSGGETKTIIEAARDGLLDVVESHIIMRTGCVYDTDDDGFTALHVAARYNRADVIKIFLDNFPKTDINIKGGTDEQRPLHVACRYNSVSALQCLLAQGAEVNVKDSKGRTPLHYATRRGHDTVTKMLLSVTSCNVNAADHDQTTPLHMAAIQGKASICELLISRGAFVTARDINDVTALMWAATEGHVMCINVLLKAALKYGQGERSLVQSHDNEGNTALHMAVQNGKLEVCEVLLDHFADINGQRHNRMTPLHLAAVSGNVEIAKLLIVRGADVNRPDSDNMTPVHRAALYNKLDVIKLLVSHGADLNAKDKKNKSPLHCACWKGQTETVLYLLENGAQVAEVDAGLMTGLHWAVQFGHYNTLLVLLKHGGKSLIEATDKNDQTVLHYAAHSGNVLVLKTLLDHGAVPDAKDSDERTPLHIAAQCDNVPCVEALIHASNHETSDDDVDGRTPLLLASAHGHHMVVQVLLSLGADISNRDDEHRTSLMVAAASGHTLVMRILLDNHVAVNDVDKFKSSALHYACAAGFVDAVQMLLDKRADVTLKNAYDQAPLDQAIDNLHNDVAIALLKHKSWRDCMNVRDGRGMNPMDRLVARLPDAAMIVLDHCVERSCRDDEDINLTMTFDYQYIDPGPDDPSSHNRRYLALNGMVEHERDTLLSHPLCQTVLYQKWVRFGRITFYVNLVIYIGYLFSLTYYTAVVGEALQHVVLDSTHYCPIFINETIRANSTWRAILKETADPNRDLSVKEDRVKILAGWVLVFILLFFFREAFKILQRGLKYFFNVFNLIALILVATTFAFIYPYGYYPCLIQWRAGWLALFLAWINFIMYLRRIDFVGIYVIMFVTVLSSLLKVCAVWIFFCWAFADAFFATMRLISPAVMVFILFCAAFGESFYVLMQYYNAAVLLYIFFCWAFAGSFFALMYTQEYYGDGEKKVFGNIGTAVLNIFVMTLGEIEFVDNFVTPDLGPFKPDVYFLLVIFLFLMPLVLMNLMIGIAVGDIEKIQRNAYLKRIALQVDLLFNFENTMPRWLQRRAYVRRAVIKPNEDNTYCWHKIKRTALGETGSVQFIHTEQKDKLMERIEYMDRQYRTQQNRMRTMQGVQQQQLAILQQIAARLKVDNLGGILETSSAMLNPDQLSMYDNMTQGPPASPLMVRVNSTRSELA